MGNIPANALFNENQRAEIAQMYKDGVSLKDLSILFRCSKSTIHRITDGLGIVRSIKKEASLVQRFSKLMVEPKPFPECRFAGIYKFTNLVNGKIYIGQSRNMYLRYGEHRRSKAAGGIQFCAALKKYGIDNFNFEVLERVDDLSLLTEREQHWVDFYQPYDNKKGYNVAKEVIKIALGRKHSEEANRVKGVRMKAFWANNPHPNLGKKHSEEARRKISEHHKQNPQTEEQKARVIAIRVAKMTKRVAQIDINSGEIIRVWKSLMSIQETLGLRARTIQKVCINRNNENPKISHAGYRWEYTKLMPVENVKPIHLQIKPRAKRVAQIDINQGNIIRIWTSANEINLELGLCAEMIKNTCRGYYVSTYGRAPKTSHAGYKWQYVD